MIKSGSFSTVFLRNAAKKCSKKLTGNVRGVNEERNCFVLFFYKKRLQSDVNTSNRLIKRHKRLSEFSLPLPRVSSFLKKVFIACWQKRTCE